MTIVDSLITAAAGRTSRTLTPEERGRLVSRAMEWSVLPPVRAWLGDDLDHASESKVTTAHREHRVAQVLLRHHLLSALDVLKGEGIEAAVLKGEPLAWMLWGDGSMRSSTDIDLLVAPVDVERALRSLGKLGFHQRAHVPLKPWTYNQVALRNQRGILLELHWRLVFPRVPAPDTAEVLGRGQRVELDGKEVPVLSPEDTLLNLVYHFHQHRGALKTVLDLGAWLDRYERSDDVSWSRIRGQVRQLGVAGLADWGLQTVARLTGEPVPRLGRVLHPVVEAWTRALCTAIRGCLTADEGRQLALIRSLQSPPAIAADLGLQALSMLVLDSPAQAVRSAMGTLVLGPHRFGTTIAGLLSSGGFSAEPRGR